MPLKEFLNWQEIKLKDTLTIEAHLKASNKLRLSHDSKCRDSHRGNRSELEEEVRRMKL